MKLLMKLALFIPALSLLGGCWGRTELNDLAIITALAFDKEDNGLIRTTVQVVIPQNQSGSGGATGGGGGGVAKRTTVRTEKGINVSDALSKLQRKLPRKLFWGQCKTFIFSDEVAKEGISETFDFLVRHPQPRERAFMFVSEGKAAEALDLFPPIERSSAEVLRGLSDLQTGIRITLEQMSMKLKGDSQSATLPIVRILHPPKSAEPYQTIPFMKGAAVFKKDRMVAELSEKVSRGVMWINNEIHEYTVTFAADGKEGLVSLRPVKETTKLVPRIVGDKWTMTIKVKTEGDMVQNGTNLNPSKPDVIDELDKAFKKDVTERIELAVDEIQRNVKADILGFGTAFHRKYPKQWEKNKARWDELFPQVEVKTVVEARILKAGLVNAPGGLPEDEVMK